MQLRGDQPRYRLWPGRSLAGLVAYSDPMFSQVRSSRRWLKPVAPRAVATTRTAPAFLLLVCLVCTGLAGLLSAAPAGAVAVAHATTPSPLRTSCKEVAHLGDSTSDGLVSADYLPDPSQRLAAQYARVGVTRSVMEIVGANSIVETLPGDEDGYQIAEGLVRQGYRGCWVIALGTNDTADVYVGSHVGLATRIKRMMSVIGNEPVLWVNLRTLLSSGPYSESDMELWNQALLAACPSYPSMRVFNWAALAQPAWFTTDGIHYTSSGAAPRAAAIADALATAFPATAGHNAPNSDQNSAARCLVNPSPSWHLPTFQY